MTFVSITFKKTVVKALKQAIVCLLKGCDQINRVIGDHVWCIVILIIVIYSCIHENGPRGTA